jgi:hypothetical protein
MSTATSFITGVAATAVPGVVDISVVCRGDLKVLKSLLMLVLEVLLTKEDLVVV